MTIDWALALILLLPFLLWGAGILYNITTEF